MLDLDRRDYDSRDEERHANTPSRGGRGSSGNHDRDHDWRQSLQQELPKATRLLDLSDDRLDDPFARCIDGGAGLREQLAGHPVDDRRVLGQRASWTRPRPLAMFLFPGRDVRVDLGLSDRAETLF